MELKISKRALLITLVVMGLQTLAFSQTQPMSPEQEKALEKKMQLMEQKIKDLQTKLDDMKVSQRAPSARQTPAASARSASKSFGQSMAMAGSNIGQAFSGIGQSIAQGFSGSDKNLADKIKSGEVKELTKSYSKSYNISRDDKLVIDNRYGKVSINTWGKNEFKVDIQIKADANQDAEAQKILDGVSITDSKDGSTVSFKTQINNENNSWGSWMSGGRTSYHKVEVNYIVYMPSKNALEISNRYGGTEIPDFDGKLTLNCSYGSLTTKALSNTGNSISSRYGSANIESLKGSDLKISYSSLDLGSCDNITADINYSPAKIGKLSTSGTINLRYGGGLKITELGKNLKNLSINSSYSPISLGFNGDPNFDFDVTVSNGSFNYGDNNNVSFINSAAPDDDHRYHTTKTYKGHFGKGNTDRVVTINARYTSVKFD